MYISELEAALKFWKYSKSGEAVPMLHLIILNRYNDS